MRNSEVKDYSEQNSQDEEIENKLCSNLLNKDEEKDKLYLEFEQLSKLTFWYFTKQVCLFSVNYFFLIVPVLASYLFFNLHNDSHSVEVIGACYIISEFFFSFSIDFQEALGIVLGPLYSARNFEKYSRYLWKMTLICMFLTLVCFPLLCVSPYLLDFLKVDESIKAACVDFCKWYALLVVPVYTLANFSKGLVGVHQLQKYNALVNFASFVLFIALLVPLIYAKLASFAFIVAYSAKFLSEAVANFFIILKNSTLNSLISPP